MRSLFTLGLTSLFAFSLAQDLGTRPDLPASTTSPVPTTSAVGGLEVVQILVVLGLVFAALKFGIPKLIAKYGNRLSPGLNSSIQVEESTAFGAGQLNVVKVRGKTLLLASTPQGVTCLADLTDTDASTNADPAFFELLDNAVQSDAPTPVSDPVKLQKSTPATKPKAAPKPNAKAKAYAKAVVQASNTETDDESLDLQARLKRLRQLVD